jgi:hypothetical protein
MVFSKTIKKLKTGGPDYVLQFSHEEEKKEGE